MPYSDPSFDTEVAKFIKDNQMSRYLDIGAGSGKYSEIISKNVKDPKIIGIEAEIEYINQFNLKDKYSVLYNQKIEDFVDENPDFHTDIVTIGDCIEHLKKSDGLDLLHFLVYRSTYIILVFPTQYVQYSWKGHDTEAHRSVWDISDFKQFEFKLKRKGVMNMVIINGFLNSSKTTYVPGHFESIDSDMKVDKPSLSV